MPTGDSSYDYDEIAEDGIYANRDVNITSGSYNVTINTKVSDDQLLEYLCKNRQRLEAGKEEYARHVVEDGGIKETASRARRTWFKELMGTYDAIEKQKAELRLRGVSFEVTPNDEEHPNAAYRRFNKMWEAERRAASRCYVVAATYGKGSIQLSRVARICGRRFVRNPLLFPSWLLYRVFGRHLAMLSSRNSVVKRITFFLIAKPIVNASRQMSFHALASLMYLASYGWIFFAFVAYFLFQFHN